MTSFRSKDKQGLQEAASYLAERLGSASFAVVLLTGPLGSGKTTLTQEVASRLGLSGLSSPTYSLLKSYDLPDGRILHHLDLYRTTAREELEVAGVMELFCAREGVFFVEWPAHLEEVTLGANPLLRVTCLVHEDESYEVQVV